MHDLNELERLLKEAGGDLQKSLASPNNVEDFALMLCASGYTILEECRKDTALIAAAVNALPGLIERVRELEEQLAAALWNSECDVFNQWTELGQDEKDELIEKVRASK